MKTIASIEGVDIIQKNYQQVIIRGDGKDHFNQLINKELSIVPPSRNLEITLSEKFLFAKHSFNQFTFAVSLMRSIK